MKYLSTGRLFLFYLSTNIVATSLLFSGYIKMDLNQEEVGKLVGEAIFVFIGYFPYAIVVFLPLYIFLLLYVKAKGGRILLQELILPTLITSVILCLVYYVITVHDQSTKPASLSTMLLYLRIFVWTVCFVLLFSFFSPESFKQKQKTPVP